MVIRIWRWKALMDIVVIVDGHADSFEIVTARDFMAAAPRVDGDQRRYDCHGDNNSNGY